MAVDGPREVPEDGHGVRLSSVDLEFLAVGCNRTAHAMSWGENGLVAYAASNATAVCSVDKVRATMLSLPSIRPSLHALLH